MYVTGILMLLCLLILIAIYINSYRNKRNGIIDEGSNVSVTIGVLFTFIGICFALYGFDSDVTKLSSNLNNFLNSMKLAFITSVMGMVNALAIKIMQTSLVRENNKNVESGLNSIPKILQQINSTKALNQLPLLINSFNEVSEVLKTSSSGAIAAQIDKLSYALNKYVENSEDEKRSMQKFIESVELQTAQVTLLKESMMQSNKFQNEQLTIMNDNIKSMSEYSHKSYDNSLILLKKTEDFQQLMLERSQSQVNSMNINNVCMNKMRESFDMFMKDMAENNNKAFIEALNESMKDLNNQLQEQFGENFKELNIAVGRLLEWQEGYKDTIEDTNSELKEFRNAFYEYNEMVVKAVPEKIEQLNNSLITFSETTERSITTQAKLADSTEKFESIIMDTNHYIDVIKENCDNFKQFSNKFTEIMNKNINDTTQAVKDASETMTISILKAINANTSSLVDSIKITNNSVDEFYVKSSEMVNDLGESIKSFNDRVTAVTQAIGKTLDTFDSDFRESIDMATDDIRKSYDNVARQTGEENKKAIEQLAAALGIISNKMTEDYQALLNRIKELDEILLNRKR